MAVLDRVLEPVHRPHGRACRPIALGVVLTAVTGTAEGLGEHRSQLDVSELLLRLLVDRPVRLYGAAEMDAAAVEDREAGLVGRIGAVVANEGRAPADLADRRILEKGRDHELTLGEVVEWAEIHVVLRDVRERRKHHEPENGQGDDGSDRCAQPDRRGLQEPRACVQRKRSRTVSGERSSLVRDCPCLGLDLRNLAANLPRHFPRPEQAEGDCKCSADGRDDPADDEADEEAGHSDRKADRPEARPRGVVVVAWLAQLVPCLNSIAPPSRMSKT